MDNIIMWTPERIAYLRGMKLALTQATMAKLLRCAENTWAQWEMGRRKPSPAQQVILDYLDTGEMPKDLKKHAGKAMD